MSFFKCDYCGAPLSLLNRIFLRDGTICRKCYDKCGLPETSAQNTSFSFIKNLLDNPIICQLESTSCGLQYDDEHKTLVYKGCAFSYTAIRKYMAFVKGKKSKNMIEATRFITEKEQNHLFWQVHTRSW